MAHLVTLTQAKNHLRIDYVQDTGGSQGHGHGHVFDDPMDDDLNLKILQASAIVIDYIEFTDEQMFDWFDTAGEPVEVPYVVRAATLLVLGELFKNREAQLSNPLSPTVKNLLHRIRNKVVK